MFCLKPLRACWVLKQFDPVHGGPRASFRPYIRFQYFPNKDSGKSWTEKDAKGFTILCQNTFLPCGKCENCKLNRSQEWALRCSHEASMHDKNCFITLTYALDQISADHSLVKKHFQDFMKRFRSRVKVPIRYYMRGEYDEQNDRPQYCALIFGYDFSDKVLHKPGDSSDTHLYSSPLLSSLWKFGPATIKPLSQSGVAYLTRPLRDCSEL